MASCWAMGRSSAEATKACLMRAAFERAALLAGLWALAGFFALAVCLVLLGEVLPVCEAAWVCVEASPVVCPATGATTISKESTPDRHRVGTEMKG